MRAFELDPAPRRESAGIPLDPPERYSGSQAAIAGLRCSISLKRAGDMGGSGDCTACTPQLVSYRRDGPAFDHMLVCVGVTGDE
ncbi:MAG: hypothetical protein JXB06_01435 [Spirochaetales bacterium]|nr:hypothetical protein [Spirochaetales bacterium]